MAWEKLGLSRSTRLERLRVAAEMGDVRRLAALLEAGSDVDAVNEPWPQPSCELKHVERNGMNLESEIGTCYISFPIL